MLTLRFILGTFAFVRLEKLPLRDALFSALYLRLRPGHFWELYSFWEQRVLFEIIISFFPLQAIQRYNPQEASRMLASQMKDLVIVVGHSHLGARIVGNLRRNSQP